MADFKKHKLLTVKKIGGFCTTLHENSKVNNFPSTVYSAKIKKLNQEKNPDFCQDSFLKAITVVKQNKIKSINKYTVKLKKWLL